MDLKLTRVHTRPTMGTDQNDLVLVCFQKEPEIPCMPNIQSAAKRARQNPKRRSANRFYRARARNAVKHARDLIESGDADAVEGVQDASSALDRAVRARAVHANLANRTKSRLSKQLNAIQTGS